MFYSLNLQLELCMLHTIWSVYYLQILLTYLTMLTMSKGLPKNVRIKIARIHKGVGEIIRKKTRKMVISCPQFSPSQSLLEWSLERWTTWSMPAYGIDQKIVGQQSSQTPFIIVHSVMESKFYSLSLHRSVLGFSVNF